MRNNGRGARIGRCASGAESRGRSVVEAIVLVLALVASDTVAVLLVYPRFKRIEKRGPAASAVIITIPQRPAAVGAMLSQAFGDGVRLFEVRGGGSVSGNWYYVCVG